ncbi:aspartate-semialdehyde dehydrogenase [Tribonema minus]|uniref:aspartate-semialdehyde dehydrogenase n=1 Tax=Tribonema minus TaxID=303371 RepID=A0A836CDN9_9STRA|nr:aspartate-semialdehyde dehydrogenase [Tribonema minus]
MATAAVADGYTVGVVGATGAVGEEIVSVLSRRGFPVKQLKLFSSARSAGKVKNTPLGDITIQEFSVPEARSCDYVFLAVDGDFAKEYAPQITQDNGPVVIDNSSAWRMDPDVPLVVPEINIAAAKGKKLIANPNCTTSIALMALYPLHKEFGVKKCIVSTYQAASGAGAPGMQELLDETKKYVTTGELPSNKVFAHPLPLNVIPHIDKFQDNMYTKEEMKVTWESRKIMGLPDLRVSCTSVRIPTLRAHSESITIETEKPVSADRAREVLRAAPGVKVVDDPLNNQYPMPLTATGAFDVEVGRIRANDVFGDCGLDFFVCGDQLLRGAALNAVLIAEALVKQTA